MDGARELCCDFGSDKLHPYKTPPPHEYVDWLGFRYRLCDRHYRAFVLGLERIRITGREGGSVTQRRGDVLRRILARESDGDAAARR